MLEYQGLKLNNTKLINPLISFHINPIISHFQFVNLRNYPCFLMTSSGQEMRLVKWIKQISDHPSGFFFLPLPLLSYAPSFFLTCSFWFAVPRYKVATNFVHPPNHITSLLLVSIGFLSLSLCVLCLGTPPFLFPFLFFLVFLFVLLGYFFRLYGLCSFFLLVHLPNHIDQCLLKVGLSLFEGIYSVFAFLHQYFVQISVFNFFQSAFVC